MVNIEFLLSSDYDLDQPGKEHTSANSRFHIAGEVIRSKLLERGQILLVNNYMLRKI
jgi:hypothetical protein